MRNFQANAITSFPSTTANIAAFGNIPAHAFLPSGISQICPDDIQSRSLGNSLGGRVSKRARTAYARPPPSAPSGRTKTQGTSKMKVFVPCKMTKPCLYKREGIEISMKKVTQFYALPVTVELPKDTPWGGVCNGESFIPGSAQLEIAQACSLLDQKNSAWASISGCFQYKTTDAQLKKTGPRFMGGSTIEPFYYPKNAKWSDLSRKPIVYIPNPSLHMTKQQLRMYKELAGAREETVGMDALEDGEPGGSEDVEDVDPITDIHASSLNDDNIWDDSMDHVNA
ncbi:unnamed protein product [Calypogeia fissa]